MLLAKSFAASGVRAHVVPVSAKTTWVLLELRLANGPIGWGEITAFGYRGEEFSAEALADCNKAG